jgi:hypothetical protein
LSRPSTLFEIQAGVSLRDLKPDRDRTLFVSYELGAQNELPSICEPNRMGKEAGKNLP